VTPNDVRAGFCDTARRGKTAAHPARACFFRIYKHSKAHSNNKMATHYNKGNIMTMVETVRAQHPRSASPRCLRPSKHL
jgi:hypothetical protein